MLLQVLLGVLFLLLTSSGALSQMVTPGGVFPSPGGIYAGQEPISLSPDVPFNEALKIIEKVGGVPIIDPEARTAPIGIEIKSLPWARTLQLIVNNNNLSFVRREKYIEITGIGPPVVKEEVEPPPFDLDSREVNISAIFFEADRRALRELGVNWSTLTGGKVSVRTQSIAGSGVSEDIFKVEGTAEPSNTFRVDFLLRSFELQNKGEIISSPEITVVSGEEGRIQVGQDFAVQTTDFSGNTITEFFHVGTMLTVTPQIITIEDIDFINLDISAERSTLIDPVLKTINITTAATKVLLMDGEETAIAGLYSNDYRILRKGFPILKDLPWWFFGIRYLFGVNRKEVMQRELIILMKSTIRLSVRERTKMALDTRKLIEKARDKAGEFFERIEEPPIEVK